MVSNDLIMPLVLQRREALLSGPRAMSARCCSRCGGCRSSRSCCSPTCTTARPATRSSPPSACSSFAAIAQLAPAFFGGLFWRRATAGGAIAGMSAGILIWAYTLLLPTFADIGVIGQHILTDGPLGLAMLRPQHLFGLDLTPLVHGVLWSLMVNVLCYVGFSLRREPSPIERLQANTVRAVRLSRRSRRASGSGARR